METLNREQIENGLDITLDWVSCTFKSLSVDDVCAVFGWIDSNVIMEMEKGARGYKAMRRVKGFNIAIMYDGQAGMGVHLDASGSAVPELLKAFRANYIKDTYGIDYLDDITTKNLFFEFVLEYGNFTRLDVALDDLGAKFYKLDDIDDLCRGAVSDKRLVSRFKNYHRHTPVKLGTLQKTGDCCYFGSRQSEMYMRIYDKQLEQRMKGCDIGIEWIRWEIEFKKERANQLAKEIVDNGSIAYVFVRVLNNYFSIRKLIDSNITRCPLDKKWMDFLATAEKLTLYVRQEEKTLEEKVSWFQSQVAPTLAGIMICDGGRLDVLYNHLKDYVTRMSREMKNICTKHVPNWEEDWSAVLNVA